ncbi:MAG TPA: M23 family metallopeptidase [Chakrabartia sp.]|nr:M23 family metallopeptidase [Chakrabartia sp.]
MFQRSEVLGGAGSGTAALTFGQGARLPAQPPAHRLSLRDWLADLAERDLVPDLGTDIGSLAWLRGFAACIALCTVAVWLGPDYRPIPSAVSTPLSGPAWEETRAQSIAPLAWGGDTGRRMAANDLVVPLGSAPERPTLDLTATLGQGDGFARLLQRAGVTGAEAARVTDMVAAVTPLADIKPGTVMKLVLGRRASPTAPRPLDMLDFRARLDLSLSIRRDATGLVLHQMPIAVDRAPLRIQGVVGDSLYRAARAAGAPAQAVETYIRAVGSKLSFATDIGADAKFDLVVERARAETGEVEYGRLLYAGLTRGNRTTQLQQWTIGGRTEWFEASGVGERRGGFTQPVAGARQTSGFGMRFHPVLGYSRMHQGVDFGAGTGTPIRAVTDGVVVFAGRKGGYGNHIRINHAGNLSTTYSHMSGYAVSSGARVLQGQIIGYVGTTGLSTGPHLHFETYRNGAVVNPRTVSFLSAPLLEGRELAAFRAKLATYQALPVNGQQE